MKYKELEEKKKRFTDIYGVKKVARQISFYNSLKAIKSSIEIRSKEKRATLKQ